MKQHLDIQGSCVNQHKTIVRINKMDNLAGFLSYDFIRVQFITKTLFRPPWDLIKFSMFQGALLLGVLLETGFTRRGWLIRSLRQIL